MEYSPNTDNVPAIPATKPFPNVMSCFPLDLVKVGMYSGQRNASIYHHPCLHFGVVTPISLPKGLNFDETGHYFLSREINGCLL